MRIRYALLTPLLLVTACSVRPDGSNGQRRDFNAPGVTYEQAYHRANDYLQKCVRGVVGLSPNITTGNLYQDESRGALQTMNGSGIVVARVDVEAAGTGSRNSIVTMKRIGLWDSRDLDAIQHAMVTGELSCK